MTSAPPSHPRGRAPATGVRPARVRDFYIDEQRDPFLLLSTLANVTPTLRLFFEQPKWARLLLDEAIRAAFLNEIAIAGDLLAQLTVIAEEGVAHAAEFDREHRHVMNEIRALRERAAVLGPSDA